jgi:hypothetical protein
VSVTRFVVDATAVLHIAEKGLEASGEHELLAPTLLRSQMLSVVHAAVHRGEVSADMALDRLDRIWRMGIRLLGDAVLRRQAWKVAEQLGWADMYDAEYIVFTQLQRRVCDAGPEARSRRQGARPDGHRRRTSLTWCLGSAIARAANAKRRILGTGSPIGHTLDGCASADRDGRTLRSPSSFRPRC